MNGVLPPRNKELPLVIRLLTLMKTMPPEASGAAVLAWIKPVFITMELAWMLMLPPLPVSPVTEVVIWELSRKMVPSLPKMVMAPPLPRLELVLMVLGSRVDLAIEELRQIDPATVGEFRGVGRAQLPSTVIGCLVHGAEHAMRHVGQLSVTTRIVRSR